jgi:hypothetical protein
MSTTATPVAAAAPKVSWLTAIGRAVGSIFSWLKSPKGQAVIAGAEGVVETIDPAATPLINLANSWISKVVTTEQIAAAAGAQSGTGVQKAAAVLTAMSPEIAKYFPTATALEIATANAAIVTFLNAFSTPAPGA